jgi:hypothetical protein
MSGSESILSGFLTKEGLAVCGHKQLVIRQGLSKSGEPNS